MAAGKKTCHMAALMRCPQGNHPAWPLFGEIVQKTPDHKTTEAVPHEMNRAGMDSHKEFIEAFSVLPQVATDSTVTELFYGKALLTQPDPQQGHIQTRHP